MPLVAGIMSGHCRLGGPSQLDSEIPWAGLVVLAFMLIYRGDNNKVMLANNGGHSTVAWQQPPLVSASQISNSLENAMC